MISLSLKGLTAIDEQSEFTVARGGVILTAAVQGL